MADINKKKAPQQDVKEINRIGNWGRIEYHHVLSCGHTEIRKRAMPTQKIACTSCVLSQQMEVQIQEIAIRGNQGRIIDGIDAADIVGTESYIISGEITINRAQSAIAKHLGIPLEAVDVVSEIGENGQLNITYAVIFMDSSQINAIMRTNLN